MPPRSALTPELIDAIEAGACILAPNQRSARWLKLRYAHYAMEQGRSAWATPDVQSFKAFAQQLWRAQSPGHQRQHERVLSSEQCKLIWERIVAESTWADHLLSPQSAASGSFRSWERMQAWQIGRDELAQSAAITGSDEARALLEWSDVFAALCKQKNWLPAAQVPHRLLRNRITTTIARIVTVGGELTPIELALCRHLAACGVQWERPEELGPMGSVIVRACETAHAELECAADWAREQLAAGAQSLAIAVPNLDERAAEIRRVFAGIFAQTTCTLATDDSPSDRAQQETSFAIASYHSLADFPIVGAALDLLALASGRASSTLAGTILRSPFLTASARESSQRALADQRIRNQAREHYDFVTLERVASTAGCASLEQCLRNAQAIRLSAPARALPSVAAESFIALWRSFGWPGEQTLDSDEKQVVARLQEALADFGALDELLNPLTFSSAVREFEQLVRGIHFEPRSIPAPITIIDVQDLDGLGCDGLSFDAIWIGGVDETRWPPPPTPDAFIPYSLQASVGMHAANAQLTREFAFKRFDRLQRLAPQVVFSWGRKDQDADILPSPWLRKFGEPQTVRPFTGATYAERVFVSRPSLESRIETTAPALRSDHARGGARIFELQSQCPFRAFAELRLDARPLDEVTPDVDARERGTLMHAALAEVWQTLGGSDGLQARSAEQLEVLIRTSLARHAAKLLEGASPHRVRMLQIEQDIAAERMMALLELDRRRMAFKVVGRPETQEQARAGALTFELRLDRMDELLAEEHRGERVIVDYKTGNNVNAASWTRDRPEQPQLPLYAVTHPDNLAAVSFVTLGAKGVGYQGVARDDGLLPGIKAFNSAKLPAPLSGWSGLLTHWRAVIERLANAFAHGRAEVDPLPNACRYCHLTSVCRVKELEDAGRTSLHEESEEGA